MRSWLSLAALAIAVAGLGLWAYWKPEPNRAESLAIATLKAGEVRRIRIERTAPAQAEKQAHAFEPIVLEKKDSEWRMTSPIAARVDPFQVERLLSIVSARSTVRYSDTGRSHYGLAPPLAVLTLDDQAFTFGAINTTTTEQYVAVGHDVYLVPLAIGAALPKSTDSLLSKSLFAANEAPIRFDLPGFTVALEEGTWAVAPALPDVSADERNAWVDAWRHAAAIAASRNPAGASQEEIKVRLKDDRSIQLRILQREPELVLVRMDEGIEYRFVAEAARRMLAPPGAARGERVNK